MNFGFYFIFIFLFFPFSLGRGEGRRGEESLKFSDETQYQSGV